MLIAGARAQPAAWRGHRRQRAHPAGTAPHASAPPPSRCRALAMRRGCSFAPLEPFLIDGPADHKRTGRIARVSLEPIWAWIWPRSYPGRSQGAERRHQSGALLDNDRIKAEQLVRALHERAIQRMQETLAAIGTDEKARRRLGVQVGTPRAIDDLAHDCRHPCDPRRARGLGSAAAEPYPRFRARTHRCDQGAAR